MRDVDDNEVGSRGDTSKNALADDFEHTDVNHLTPIVDEFAPARMIARSSLEFGL